MGWFGLPHSMAAGFPKRVFQKSQVKIRDILIVSFSLRCRITSIQPHSIGQDCHNVCPDSSGENCWLDKSNIEVTLLKKKKTNLWNWRYYWSCFWKLQPATEPYVKQHLKKVPDICASQKKKNFIILCEMSLINNGGFQ